MPHTKEARTHHSTTSMAKKMKIPSIFKNKEAKHPWHCLPCKQQPKTLSFRADDKIFTTIFFDPSDEEDCGGEVMIELIIRGVQSERLIFEPANTGSSILNEVETSRALALPFKESEVLAIESDDPYKDFKESMEEMVKTHGLEDWECLEELFGWYLKINERMNHEFIVGAFVDLVSGLASSSSCSNSTNFCRCISTLSSPPIGYH